MSEAVAKEPLVLLRRTAGIDLNAGSPMGPDRASRIRRFVGICTEFSTANFGRDFI